MEKMISIPATKMAADDTGVELHKEEVGECIGGSTCNRETDVCTGEPANDEALREEVFRLKRKEFSARLKGVPFVPTDEEKSLLEKWEAKMSISADDTSIIIPPTGGMAKYINNYVQNNILDTKEESIVLSSHDMLKKKRDELRQKGGFGTRDKQIMKPQGAFTYRTVREQWILNESVKVLFENESLLKVYQGVNIPDEMGQNMDDYDAILKQRREELRKRLLSPGMIIE